MTPDERKTCEILIAAGWTQQEIDEHTRPAQPIRRTVDKRLVDSALRLDLLNARIEAARQVVHKETADRLRRLGYDVSNFRPPIAERPSEHLARALASAAEPPLTATTRHGPLIRRPIGQVLGVR